jgi:hypothetical protein
LTLCDWTKGRFWVFRGFFIVFSAVSLTGGALFRDSENSPDDGQEVAAPCRNLAVPKKKGPHQ